MLYWGDRLNQDTELALVQELKAGKVKFCYFIMAASGSAIGFAITQTKTTAFETHHYIWLAAVIFWALSFFCGIRYISKINSVIFSNVTYLQNKRKIYGGSASQEFELQQLNESKFHEAVSEDNNSLVLYGHAQVYLLLSGALVYVIWHVYRMWDSTLPVITLI